LFHEVDSESVMVLISSANQGRENTGCGTDVRQARRMSEPEENLIQKKSG
jgi:hypothetical protein